MEMITVCPTTTSKPRQFYRERQRDRAEVMLLASLNELDKKRINEFDGWKERLEKIREHINAAISEVRQLA